MSLTPNSNVPLPPPTENRLKYLLRGLSSAVAITAGIFFLFGGRAIHEFGGVDRWLAELIGIGVAFLCLIGYVVARHVIDDIEWKEANEEYSSASKTKP